jgi:hypothetical protein
MQRLPCVFLHVHARDAHAALSAARAELERAGGGQRLFVL